MNLGRYMLIIGAIIIGVSYVPLVFLFFGQYTEFLRFESANDSGMILLVPYEAVPLIQIFTYGGFGLLIAGLTFRFWRRK